MSEETKVVTGVIEKAFKRDNGMCSIKIGDDWYSTYKTHYGDLEGKTVEITLVKKGQYWNLKGKPSVVASSTPKAAAATQSYDDKQNSIVLQSSYRTAAEAVAAAATAGYLPMPTKKADQWDAFKGFINEYALELFKACTNATEFTSEAVEDENPAPSASEYNPMEA
jgi:hypothetical protein